MRVLVCGGREYSDQQAVFSALDEIYKTDPDIIVIQGGAPGADLAAKHWTIDRQVPCYHFPARWRLHGKKAGPLRNAEMLEKARPDLVLGFPTPGAENKGTNHMMKLALDAGIPVINVTATIDFNVTVEQIVNKMKREKLI